MGLFSKLKTKPKAMTNDEIFENIFGGISNADEEVKAGIKSCLENIRLYCLKNPDGFDNRGLDVSKTPEFTLKWIGCVDILIKNGYAAEIDNSVDFKDFYAFFAGLKIVSQRSILPDENDIYLDYDPISWFNCIDRVWAKSGMCVGGIDIDSDSYVFFPCTVEQLAILSENADKAGRKICRAAAL